MSDELDNAKRLWDAETAAFRAAVDRGATDDEIVAAVQMARIGHRTSRISEAFTALAPAIKAASAAFQRLRDSLGELGEKR